MKCVKCGKQLPENAMFCDNCGTRVSRSEDTGENDTEKEAVTAGAGTVGGSGDIKLCRDGKYRWYYEFPILKNPVILFTIWKIMLIAAAFPALIVLLSELSGGIVGAVTSFAMVFGVAFVVTFVLSCVGYFITAVIYGFKYIVLFEMDDISVTHAQQDKQFNKAQAVSWLTVLAGTANGQPGVIGTGLLAGSRQQITSEFKKVSTVIGVRKSNTIKVNQLLAKNQVYVKPEDYDFVWEYITSRCKKAEIR